MSLDLKDVMTRPFPSRQCVQARFIRKVMELIPCYERCLQLIGGVTLCGDKSCKVVKFIFVGGSRGCVVRAFDSVCTVMNEFKQIVTIHFVLAGDHEEVESILQQIQHCYDVHGCDEVTLFHADMCCHECKMMTRAIPSLARGDTEREEDVDNEAHLCTATLPFEPVLIDNCNQLVRNLTSLLKILDEAESPLFIGCDAKWDSGTVSERALSTPEMLQLAWERPPSENANGPVGAAVDIWLQKKFPQAVRDRKEDGENNDEDEDIAEFCQIHNILARVLTHTNATLVGVNVKADLTRINR